LHSRDQRPAFTQAIAAADLPGAPMDSTPVWRVTVTTEPADGTANVESESVRWKVRGRGRKWLLHEPVIARWNGSLQGTCNAWPMGAEVSDMEWY